MEKLHTNLQFPDWDEIEALFDNSWKTELDKGSLEYEIKEILVGFESRKKLEEVLEKLSTLDDNQIANLWSNKHLNKHLQTFTRRFRKSKHFIKYSREIGASIRSLSESQRMKEIQYIVDVEGPFMNEAVALRLFYLMQGLTDKDDSTDTPLETLLKDPAYQSVFKRFQAVLNSDDVERFTSSVKEFSDAQTRTPDDQAKLDAIDAEVDLLYQEVLLEISTMKTNKTQKHQDRKLRRAQKKVDKGKGDKIDVTREEAKNAYDTMQTKSGKVIARFEEKYPGVFEAVIEALPLSVITDPNFGLQTGVDKDDNEESIEQFKILDMIARPYQLLLEDPDMLWVMAMQVSAGKTDFDGAKAYMTKELNKIQPDPTWKFEAELLYSPPVFQVMDMDKPDLLTTTDRDEIAENDQKALVFGKVEKLLQNRLSFETNPALLKMSEDSQLIRSVLEKGSLYQQLTDQTKDPKDHFDQLYFGAEGLLKEIQRSELWASDDTSTIRLVVSMIVNAGLGQAANDLIYQNSLSSEAEQVLTEWGFSRTLGYDKGNATVVGKQDIPEKGHGNLKMTWEIIKDQWQDMGPKPGFFKKIGKVFNLLRGGAYFLEGYFNLPDFNKGANIEGLSLTDMQDYFGGHFYGLELDTDQGRVEAGYNSFRKAMGVPDDVQTQASGDLDIRVQERLGRIDANAFYMPLASIAMDMGDMTVKSEEGFFGGFVIDLSYDTKGILAQQVPATPTIIKLHQMALSNLQIVYNNEIYAIGGLSVEGLKITSNQSMGTFDEMRNWSVLMDTVIDFFYNVFMGLLDATMTSVVSFLPDLEKDTVLASGKTADQELSELLYNAFGENFDINLNYDKIVMTDFISSTMGRIGNVTIEDGGFGLQHVSADNEVTSSIGANSMKITDIDISGVKTDTVESGKFSLKSHFDSPGGANTSSQVAQLTNLYGNDPIPPSKLKKLEFDFASLESTPIDFMGEEVNIPFKEIRGYAEFSPAGDLLTVHIDYLDQINFLKLPTKKGDNLYFETTPDSKFLGTGVSLTIDVGLNDVFDQKMNGLVPQWMHIQDIHFDKVTGEDFVMIYGGYRFDFSAKDDASTNPFRASQGGSLEFVDVNLTNSYLELKRDKDTGDKTYSMESLGKITSATSNIQGMIAQLADDLAVNFDKFDARGLLTIEQITNSAGDEIFDFTALRATTKGSYNVDPGDKGKKSLVEFEVQEETKLHGAYNATTGELSLNDFTIPELWLPTINWHSSDNSMHILATDTGGNKAASTDGVFLRGITPDITMTFNQSDDPDVREAQPLTAFEIKSLEINEIVSNGIHVDMGADTNIDIPKNKKVTIKGAFLENMRMVSNLEWITDKDDNIVPKVSWEREEMFNPDGTYAPTKTGVDSLDIPEGVTFQIKKYLEGDMRAITSGEIWFEWLEGGGYKYSATDLDMGGKITHKLEEKRDWNNSDIDKYFDFDLDSKSLSGSYVTGVDADGRKYKVIQQTFDIPKVDIHQSFLLTDDRSMTLWIPNSGKTSYFQNVTGSVSVKITEATKAAKEKARLAREKAKADPNQSRTEYERFIERLAETQEAAPDILLTVDSLDVEKAEIYEMDLALYERGGLENNVFFDVKEKRVKLRKGESAILRKLHIKGLTAFLPGEEGQKAVMSVAEDGEFKLGGKDEEGNTLKGLEFGQAGFASIHDTVRTVMAGHHSVPMGWGRTVYKPTHISRRVHGWEETNVESSFMLDEFTFSGSTDGAYNITIKEPSGDMYPITRIWNNQSSMYDYVFESGDTSWKKYGVKLPGTNTRIFEADEITIVNKLVKESDPSLGYQRVITMVNPVLNRLEVDRLDNYKLPFKFETMILSGKVEGKLMIIENTDVNMAPRQELVDGGDFIEKGGTIIKAVDDAGNTDAATITIEDIEFITKGSGPYEDEHGREGTDDYNFINSATGWIVITLFGHSFTLPVEEITYYDPDKGENVTEGGWVEMGPLVRRLGDFLTDYTWGRPDWVLGDLDTRLWRDDGNFTGAGVFAHLTGSGLFTGDDRWEYVIMTEEVLFWKAQTLLRQAERNLARIDGRTMSRLAKIVDSMVNHEDTEMEDDFAGYTSTTLAQFRTWLNREDNPMNPQIELDLEFDLSTLDKNEKSRGMMNIFTGDDTIEFNANYSMDQTFLQGSRSSRDLSGLIDIDSLTLPQFRIPIGTEDEEKNEKAASAVFSGKSIEITNLHAEEWGGAGYNVKANNIKIKGFELQLPPKTETETD